MSRGGRCLGKRFLEIAVGGPRLVILAFASPVELKSQITWYVRPTSGMRRLFIEIF